MRVDSLLCLSIRGSPPARTARRNLKLVHSRYELLAGVGRFGRWEEIDGEMVKSGRKRWRCACESRTGDLMTPGRAQARTTVTESLESSRSGWMVDGVSPGCG